MPLSPCRLHWRVSFGYWIVHPNLIRRLSRMLFMCGIKKVRTHGRFTKRPIAPTTLGEHVQLKIWLLSWLTWGKETPHFLNWSRAYVTYPYDPPLRSSQATERSMVAWWSVLLCLHPNLLLSTHVFFSILKVRSLINIWESECLSNFNGFFSLVWF